MKLKQQIVDHVKQTIKNNFDSLKQEIESIQKSKNSETKSSAGDKFETSRAMLQSEIVMKKTQLDIIAQQILDLSKISFDKISKKVRLGSLVQTQKGIYVLAIGLGKITIEGKTYYSISAVSPFGKTLIDKELGDKFVFNNNEFEIIKLN